ncbi:hypothetical protein, partial [Parvimonas sp. M20]|uniref:hypothetical protein n=1 Tax=Parvimonas sp. M20 TaxID=3110693 RepID=UPI002B478E47
REITDDVRTNARVLNEESTRANADSALAGRASTIEANVANLNNGLAVANGRITDESNARATAVDAVASRTTVLETSAPVVGNWLSNTPLANLAGWNATSNPSEAGAFAINGNGNDWRPGTENAMSMNQWSIVPGYMELQSDSIAVEGGTWIQAYARTANHRCNAWVSLF